MSAEESTRDEEQSGVIGRRERQGGPKGSEEEYGPKGNLLKIAT